MLRYPALLAALLLVSTQAIAGEAQRVTFAGRGENAPTLTGYLRRPADSTKPAPAIVALHGCGGLFNRRGEMTRRHSDWADRFVAAGYVVLFPDSFGSRGLRSICRDHDRSVRPSDRAGDAAAAADWLAAQPYVDSSRIGVLGWSNGGGSVLWAIGGKFKPSRADWRVAIAFYPGCRVPAESVHWKPRMQPYVLIGSADNWTSPIPCRRLAERGAVRLIEYPGAVHGFDAPNAPRRTLHGVAYSSGGDGNVETGTDPKARAGSIKEVMTILGEAFK